MIDEAGAIREFRMFPEVECRWTDYDEEMEEDEGPQLYDFFGQVVDPYLFRATLDSSNPEASKLKQIFDLVEDLARDGTDSLKLFVRIEICETLLAKDDRIAIAFPYIGPVTATICRAAHLWKEPSD
jgi:hypothetical protein